MHLNAEGSYRAFKVIRKFGVKNSRSWKTVFSALASVCRVTPFGLTRPTV